MNILIIGSGGREHAISWKVSKSNKVKKIFVVPGNPGIVVKILQQELLTFVHQ